MPGGSFCSGHGIGVLPALHGAPRLLPEGKMVGRDTARSSKMHEVAVVVTLIQKSRNVSAGILKTWLLTVKTYLWRSSSDTVKTLLLTVEI